MAEPGSGIEDSGSPDTFPKEATNVTLVQNGVAVLSSAATDGYGAVGLPSLG